MNGVLVIDKPSGFTSHDVVARVRRIFNQRDVGHLGTLDPMATGVLPLVMGNMTRLARFYLGSEKRYEGVVRFGFATDTYDAEGEPSTEHREPNLTLDQLRSLAMVFKIYSCIHARFCRRYQPSLPRTKSFHVSATDSRLTCSSSQKPVRSRCSTDSAI